MAAQVRNGARAEFLAFVQRHEIAWELTMAALAVAYVAVGFLSDEPGAPSVYGYIDDLVTAIFVAEFVSRFATSALIHNAR